MGLLSQSILSNQTAVKLDWQAPTSTLVLTGTFNISSLTASSILSADASNNLVSLATATYPSLTELSYVKGVTSAIQTQISAVTSSQWTLSSTNLYAPTADTVTVGTDTTTLDTSTIHTASTSGGSGLAVHSIPSGVGGSDSFTKLLLHLSATPFVDSSTNAYTVTNTNITLDTTNKVLGAAGSAASTGGAGRQLSIPNVANFNISSGSWTISFWFRPNNDTGAIYDKTNGSSPFQGYYLRYVSSTNKLEYYTDSNNLRITQSDTLTDATWYYVEMNSDGTTTTMYVGPVGGTAVSKGTTTNTPTEFNSPLLIFNQSSTAPLAGNIQEFKFDKGVQRHTASFSVPTAPWDTGSPNSFPSLKLYNGIVGSAVQTAKIWTDGSNSDRLVLTGGTTDGLYISSAGAPSLPTLTTNGYVKTSGAVGTLGIQAVPIPVADGGTGQTTAVVLAASVSTTGTATTTFTVTIGTTQANATYKVNVTPTSLVAAAVFYVNNKTTTTFDVVYLAGLTGAVSFDWAIFK